MRARHPHYTAFRRGGTLLGALLLALPAMGETVLVGDRDNFVGPDDPNGVIVRRAAFDAFVSHPSRQNCILHSCNALPFDTNDTLNWDFGHSFMNLPLVAGATLEIHVRGGAGGAAGNDWIALQYINTGDPNDPLSYAWGWWGRFAFLETVPGAISDGDGVWSNNDELTIVLDLAALPQSDGTTVNLLPMIAGDGYLDVYITDDTDVDYIELNYTPAYFGLPHVPLGQAVMDFGPLDPNNPDSPQVLTVSNLGSSGDDGIDIRVCNGCGPGQGGGRISLWGCIFSVFDAMSNRVLAMSAGTQTDPHGRSTISFYGPDNESSPALVRAGFRNLDPYADPILFQVLSGGTVIHSETGFQSDLCGFFPGAYSCTEPVEMNPCALIDSIAWRVPDPRYVQSWIGWEVRFTSSETLNMPSGAVVSGDVLRIVSDSSVSANWGAESLTITGSSSSPGFGFTIAGEAVQLFGLFEQVMGQAQFRFDVLDPNDPNSPTTMTIWNIGDSGQDGVQIDLDQAASATMLWNDLAPSTSGAWLELGVAGSVGGTTQDLGSTRVSDTGGSLEVTVADFGAYQSIAVLNNGQIVSSAHGHIGPIAAVSDWPTGAIAPGPGDPLCPPDCPAMVIAWTWSSPVTIEVPGSAPVVGDMLVIANPQGTAPSNVTTATLRAADIPSITLVDIVVSVPPCPGDVNGDRTVDLTDLAILLSNFDTTGGAGPGDGDLDGDGDVDLSDLSILLSNFDTLCS